MFFSERTFGKHYWRGSLVKHKVYDHAPQEELNDFNIRRPGKPAEKKVCDGVFFSVNFYEFSYFSRVLHGSAEVCPTFFLELSWDFSEGTLEYS